MFSAVPVLGGAAATVGAPPTGAGTLATFGAPITLKVLVAAAIKMVCWRCCSSATAGVLAGSWTTDAASGSAWVVGSPIRYLAPPAMATAAVTVVSKKARTLLRARRPPDSRLRCCDNAILPSANRARQDAGRAGPPQSKAASLVTDQLLTVASANYGQNHRNKEPSPSRDHVARIHGDDQAFPWKKLWRTPMNLCRADHSLAISTVTITGCYRRLGCDHR